MKWESSTSWIRSNDGEENPSSEK